MQSEETYFRLKPITDHNRIIYVPEEKRKEKLDTMLAITGKVDIRGGTQATNPMKKVADIVIAEKLAQLELMKESKLWSPSFTPKKFKYTFLLPVALGVGLIFYLHFIQIPKNMLYWKRKRGFVFRDLEKKGMLQDWFVEDYKDDIYGDEVLQELELMTNSSPPDNKEEKEIIQSQLNKETRVLTDRARMDNKFTELYNKRKNLRLD